MYRTFVGVRMIYYTGINCNNDKNRNHIQNDRYMRLFSIPVMENALVGLVNEIAEIKGVTHGFHDRYKLG